MTKDKILSAEEMFDQYILDGAIQRGQKDGIEQLAEMKVEDKEIYDSVILLLNRFAAQFYPPTMTEEELRDEAEKLYPDSKVSAGYYVRLQREAHIKARKMGAIQLTTK